MKLTKLTILKPTKTILNKQTLTILPLSVSCSTTSSTNYINNKEVRS